ncbi:restriction endonuclease [Candidatus Woesearchaeota archaeon]|nr:restriction endonuclease [Candidatus Woesearchaeota archaeon]
MPTYVVKANGEREAYDPAKLTRTLMRAGASEEHAKTIVTNVRVYDGMPTKDLLRKVLTMLRSTPAIASRYDLKGALMRLGPTGFTFEKMVARLLEEYGYITKTNLMLRGTCVTHETDVIASKNGKTAFVECKYHNESGIYTGLHVSMYTWARFVDLSEGAKAGLCEPIDAGWLVTNTKFSSDAATFGTCRGLRLIGWNFPKDHGIAHMIESRNLWPVTVFRLDTYTLEQLAAARLLLVKDICGMNPEKLSKKIKIPRPKADELVRQARELCGQAFHN